MPWHKVLPAATLTTGPSAVEANREQERTLASNGLKELRPEVEAAINSTLGTCLAETELGIGSRTRVGFARPS